MSEGIALALPADPPMRCRPPRTLATALGAEPEWVGRARCGYLVVLAGPDEVRSLRPDPAAVARLRATGVVVTAADGRDADFVSRYFAPAVGIAEDPVTGSAHCALGPFWAGRLGRPELVGHQVSQRGGRVGVRVAAEAVVLTGQAVTVLRGQLL